MAQLAPDQVADVRRTLHASINDLEKRGLITAADAQRARSLELGALELRMSRFAG